MATLKIKNFGAFEENKDKSGNLKDNGFFTVEFKPVTVLIGEQSSGKSTLLKLYSTFIWLEKALIQGKETVRYGRFDEDKTKYYLDCHGIYSYIKKNTGIEFFGQVYKFFFKDKKIFAEQIFKNIENYYCPKIVYVPSERNLFSVNEKNADNMKNLNEMIKLFQYRYDEARKASSKGLFELPINNLSAKYYKASEKFAIVNKDKSETLIQYASSGCQSVAPLSIVSDYFARKYKVFDFNLALKKELTKTIRNQINKTSSESDAQFFNEITGLNSFDEIYNSETIKSLSDKFSYLFNRCFINIVEEPEQNLFPTAQAATLYNLIEYKNMNSQNCLVFSTHSPYILSALNNSILAYDVYKKTKKEIKNFKQERRTFFDNISAYKCSNNGIVSIIDKEDRLINADAIDDCSVSINNDFDELLALLSAEGQK